MKKIVNVAVTAANQSETDRLRENAIEFVETAIIDCSQEIGTLQTSVIPGLQLQLKKAENALAKAQARFENARFSYATNFEQYLRNREDAQDHVDSCQESVNNYNHQIEDANRRLAAFQAILEDLNAEVEG